MRASRLCFVGPRSVRVEEGPVPSPGEGELLVEARRSLVSAGTERMIYRGEAPAELAADDVLDGLEGDLSYPLAYGYALTGEVADVGPGVAPSWAGREVFAFAPHGSHALVTPESLFPVPDDVDGETAAFLPIAETAVNLVLDTAPRLGERAVVFGAGLVGLFAIASLASFPLSSVTVVEPLPGRRQLADRLGADRTVAPGESPTDADLALEVSGVPEALDEAVSAVGYAGRVVVGSWYGDKRADLDLGGRFHRDRVEVASSQVSTIAPELRGRWDRDRRMELAWEALRAMPVGELITHRVPVEEADRAYRLLDRESDGALGVLLTYA